MVVVIFHLIYSLKNKNKIATFHFTGFAKRAYVTIGVHWPTLHIVTSYFRCFCS